MEKRRQQIGTTLCSTHNGCDPAVKGVWDQATRLVLYVTKSVSWNTEDGNTYCSCWKYILTLLCSSTHTYTHPSAHTHTYIFNINLVCQVILKWSEEDRLYDFHLDDCIIYFISCDSMVNSSSSHTMHSVYPQIRLTRPGITSTVEAILFIADVAEWTYD